MEYRTPVEDPTVVSKLSMVKHRQPELKVVSEPLLTHQRLILTVKLLDVFLHYYEAMLDRLLAFPGQQNLPLLSQKPIKGIETLWFDRHGGKLSRAIAGIFRRKFDGLYYSWKVTPQHIQERYYRTFARKFNWDSGINELVREGFEKIAKKRMKGIVNQAKQSGEEELGRPVLLGEVFMRTHTRSYGSFVDQKAKQVAETYEKTLEERLSQLEEDGPQISDNSSQQSSHRILTVDEKNEIFLQYTQTNDKGNHFGLGSLVQTLNKRKRKENYASSSTSTIVDLQELRRKIFKHDADNARRDEEHRQYQSEISSLKKLLVFMKQNDPSLAAFLECPTTDPDPTTLPPTRHSTTPPAAIIPPGTTAAAT
ncbi:uncharacterized protein LOC111828958 [Capsella rubella]|uniref:uncharacterized protein LOC111828958 n=1 Tax=Capsella rubella TaxID=81985 RepID=UPI000CD4B553|nr:uncharacterized protein LOC111828958 [Capsella rubella]